MAINRKMFAEIHQLITEFPELHNQPSWETDPDNTGNCGTTRCVAGWAVWLGARDAGLLTRKREFTDGVIRDRLVWHLDLTEDDSESSWYYNDYGLTDYPVLGGKLLGLDGDQAHSLFHDMHRERVVARVKSFAETGKDLSEEEYESFFGEEN